MSEKLLSFEDLRAKGLYRSRITCWRHVKAGLFPAPIKIGPRLVRWRESDVRQFVAAAAVAAYGGEEKTA